MIDPGEFQAEFLKTLTIAVETRPQIDSDDVALLLRFYRQLREDYHKVEAERCHLSITLQRVEDDYIQLRTEHMTPEEYTEAYAGMDEPSSDQIIAEVNDVLEKQRKSLEGMPSQRLVFDDGLDANMDGED